MNNIYLPATSEEKATLIRSVLTNFYGQSNVKIEVSHKAIPDSEGEDQFWIFVDIFPPSVVGDQRKLNEIRQTYMTEAEKIMYGALERKNWRFDSFKTDQGQVYDCILTKVIFPEEIKVGKNKTK